MYLIDIDECTADTHNCDQVCLDHDGTFSCSCNSGYELDGDGTTCNGMMTLMLQDPEHRTSHLKYMYNNYYFASLYFKLVCSISRYR